MNTVLAAFTVFVLSIGIMIVIGGTILELSGISVIKWLKNKKPN
jgi:hypothetical protein